MDIFTDLIQGVQDDLNIGDDSTLYPQALVKRYINRAYRNKVAALFPWPELQDAKKTPTQANIQYYDYPNTWRSNSIWKLSITDTAGTEERYGEDPDGSPLTFDDFLNWKEDYPDGTEKKWANQQRRYFVTPTPTAAGSIATGIRVISIWGIKIPTALSADGDTTVFSYSMPEGNEALVLEAAAMLKTKGEQEKSAEFKSTEAKQILAVAWGKIRKENAKYEKNQPFFDVPNWFGDTTTKDLRGKFDI